jgi:hypothetical protein
MRSISVVAVAFAGLAAFTAPATAATILMANYGNPLDEKIRNNHYPWYNTGKSLVLNSDSHFRIAYLSDSTLHYPGSSNGYAQVTGVNGHGFEDLTIIPLSNLSFTKFKFNLDIPSPDVSHYYTTDFTFDAQVFFAGGGSQTFTDVDLGSGNGSNRFLITAGLNELIDKIVLSNLVGTSTKSGHTPIIQDYNFSAIKQASFDFDWGFASCVPEPATWAEFILGFGLMGVMLRRQRRQSAVPATA